MGFVAMLLAMLAVPVTLFAAETQPKPDDMVNNPPFAHWSAFKPGTAVTQRETITLSDGTKLTQDITSKLLEKNKEKVVVETSYKESGGGVTDQEKTVTAYPAKVKMSQVDTPDAMLASITEGTEKVTVKGKEVDAEWVEAVSKEGDEVVTEKIWTARDIPGGIIKRTITRKKGDKVVSESVLEVLEFSPKG